MARNPPVSAGDVRDWVQSLDREDPLEEDRTTHSSVLAWRIPWTEEPGGLQSMGLQRVRHDWGNLARTHTQLPGRGAGEAGRARKSHRDTGDTEWRLGREWLFGQNPVVCTTLGSLFYVAHYLGVLHLCLWWRLTHSFIFLSCSLLSLHLSKQLFRGSDALLLFVTQSFLL